MKPDDDFEDLDDGKQGGSRAMSWMVLAVAVVGFGALAFYAYKSGKEVSGETGEATTIQADQAPIKESPTTPDGEQFANKDKTIYDVIAPDGQKTGEKLLPEPERPVAAANTEDEDSIAAAQDSAPIPAVPAAPAPAAPVVVDASKAAPTTYVAETPKFEVKTETKTEVKKIEPKPEVKAEAPKEMPMPEVKKEAPVETAKAEEKSYSSPQMVNETTVTGKKEEPAAAAPTKTEEAAPSTRKAEDKPAKKGAYRVQLGAYASEAEAQSAWDKISKKFGLRSTPSIIKAEVNGKTYYRLRAGSFPTSADAKSACSKLTGQACMPVK